jgi:hypothetical protein
MNRNKREWDFDKFAPGREKIRLIFVPYLLLTVGVIALCSVLYWFFVYQRGMERDTMGLIFLLIPIAALFLIMRRLNLIERKREAANRLFFLLYMLPVFVPLMILQTYIDTGVGKLTRLNDLTEINANPPTRFYTVEAPTHTTRLVMDFTYYRRAGHRSSQKRLDTYCVTPLYSEVQSNHAAWLGLMYTSQPFPPDQKLSMDRSFIPASVERFEAEIRRPFRYLERITLNKKSGYYLALDISSILPQEITVLIPHYGPFEERAGNSLRNALLAFVIGAGIVGIAVLLSPFNEGNLRSFLTGERSGGGTPAARRRPSKAGRGERTDNDKRIAVGEITRTKLERDLKEVCELYNGDGGRMYPELEQTGETEFVLTFPCDIDLKSFCYLVNYLCYPVSGGDRARVTGWTTATAGDRWITPELAGKRLMLYVPEQDREYDNVYATSEDDKCYQFGFDGKTVPLPERIRPYQQPVHVKK